MKMDDWVAIAVIVTGAATIVTAIVAVWSLSGSRHDSRQRTRPLVVADLQPSLLTKGVSDLLLHNYGATAARKLVVAFDPPLKAPEEYAESENFHWISRRYQAAISLLAPGATLANVYKLPDEKLGPFTVKVAYSASDGQRYHDHFKLDPAVIGAGTISTPGDSNDREIRLIRALEALVRVTGKRP